MIQQRGGEATLVAFHNLGLQLGDEREILKNNILLFYCFCGQTHWCEPGPAEGRATLKQGYKIYNTANITMSRILQPYEQFIASNDLTSDHVLGDIFFSLESLTVTINNVFERIGKRLDEENTRVKLVNERVATCQSKVKHITGSNKATTVFSTAKFPAPKNLPPPHTIFSQNISQSVITFPEAEDELFYAPAEAKKAALFNHELTGILVFLFA
jgi:hypothetical protein